LTCVPFVSCGPCHNSPSEGGPAGLPSGLSTLPAPSRQPLIHSQPGRKARHAPQRILYPEDYDDTRDLVTTLLRRTGFDATEAANARGALESAPSGGFDLYLLEHVLPDASGLEVCRALRAAHPETSILFCSGRGLPEEREAALEAGAQDYLVESNDFPGVARHVAKWVGRKPYDGGRVRRRLRVIRERRETIITPGKGVTRRAG
jgi:DNA-binding response OmpR family regulator